MVVNNYLGSVMSSVIGRIRSSDARDSALNQIQHVVILFELRI